MLKLLVVVASLFIGGGMAMEEPRGRMGFPLSQRSIRERTPKRNWTRASGGQRSAGLSRG